LDEFKAEVLNRFPKADISQDGGTRAEVFIAANQPFTVRAACNTDVTFTPEPNKNYELISESYSRTTRVETNRYIVHSKCFTVLYDLDEHKITRFEKDNSCSKTAKESQKDSNSKP
jgi:hypothetical protein